MWINRGKFERMERDIDNLTDRVKSLERIIENAGDEPTFMVDEEIIKDLHNIKHVVRLEEKIYLYIDKHEYVIDAPELPSLCGGVDYKRSSLKITSTGFAYIDVCIDNGLYKYVSAYKDETCIYLGCEDISKRDAAEQEVPTELDSYRFHDLRKDPTDLPEKYGEDWVLVKVKCTGMDGKPILAEYRNGKWFGDSDHEVAIDNWSKVIGWFKIYDPCLSSCGNLAGDGEEVK